MGGCLGVQNSRYVVYVKTGDKKNAGTDANVRIKLHDSSGKNTEALLLDNFLENDMEQGNLDVFPVDNVITGDISGDISMVEFWRDNAGLGADWYLDRIVVEDKHTKDIFIFPVFRWIQPDVHYRISHLDTSLPQKDPTEEQRKQGVDEKREVYDLATKFPGAPAQVKTMPADEAFSFDSKWDILKTKAQVIDISNIDIPDSGKWESIADLKSVYTRDLLCEPQGVRRWHNDLFFAHQRIASMNSSCIELCTKLPEKLAVTEETVNTFLEGWTLQQMLKAKRLFFVDHKILQDLPCREGYHCCAPIALFFVNGNYQLIPIAIQLYQDASEDNPVFFPTDPQYTWMMAKMWFNNADSNVHQALTHLCYTHLLMEGVTVVTHRNMSPSHPIFKLLAPHFLYLIGINACEQTTMSEGPFSHDTDRMYALYYRRTLEWLITPDGWVDNTTNIGVDGMHELIRRGISSWRMDVEGTLPENLRSKGVLLPHVLPNYYFRDDAILLYHAIHKYVQKYVDLYYDSGDTITEDYELQDWGDELVADRQEGGCGLLGVPGDGIFRSQNQLYTVLTSIIYTCSVAHAAASFPQYDEYAFPPNYPALLNGEPPRDKTPLDETSLLDALPDKPTTLNIMAVTKILSSRGIKPLGDFEVNYIFDPKARKIAEEFRENVAAIGRTIKERNKERHPPYTALETDTLPNSINI